MQQEIELGAAYFVGRGVERNEKLAAYWYEKAANSGDPVAQKQIGYFYQVGIGVPRDPVRAVRWFERAVSGGLVEAKVNLGVVYLWGFGVRKDLALSAQLFQEAAEKGNGLGACYLGDMYYFGHGMPKDDAAAKHWYEAGTKLHDPLAEYRLGILLSNHQNDQHDMRKAAQLFRENIAQYRQHDRHDAASAEPLEAAKDNQLQKCVRAALAASTDALQNSAIATSTTRLRPQTSARRP